MLETIFLIAAVIGGTVLVCQFVLTVLGLAGDGFDAGYDGSDLPSDASIDHHTPMHHAADADVAHPDSSWLFGVLSFRTMIAAMAFFGLTGTAALSAGFQQSTSVVLAVCVGVAAMYGMYWLMKLIGRLDASGNEQIDNALGQLATVYVPIPPEGQGAGKVRLTMQNRIVEYRAVTDEDTRLSTGESVEVIDVESVDLLCVRRVRAAVEA